MISSGLYGLLAEFASADLLLQAARRAREAGYCELEAYSPFPVEGLGQLIESRPTRVPFMTLAGGIIGGAGTYFLLWYSAVIDFPFDSGARPLHSWPAFIPATFELTILGAALAAFLSFVLSSGLPRLNHPIFNAPDFDLASRNRFFMVIRSTDLRFDRDTSRHFLRSLDALRIAEVTA